ncbi:MAG: hypothetical protein EOP83_25625 [Verrucomicrobiaceae bacterium]|nr:MAG: hypothetical protein EOP83_25625 [Verrucomicrobiaceae bacterium]
MGLHHRGRCQRHDGRGSHPRDRAGLDHGTVQQGAAADPLGAFPRPPQPPITSRWGDNIRYVRDHEVVEATDGRYADNPLIYQAAGVVPQFDGQHVAIGSFVVGDQPAGMILRESESAIVRGEARVVPHYVME